MKTIEERAAIYFGVLEEKRLPRVIFEDILRELAADLQAEHERSVNALNDTLSVNLGQLMEAQKRLAEKEKEVAELREANRRIANESIANQLALQSVCYKQRAALEYYAGSPWVGHAGSWANSSIAEPANVALENKFDSSLLDEVKGVLVQATLVNGQEEIDALKFDATRLLTRLGSHE